MAKKEEKAVKEKSKENKVKKHFFKDFKAELKKVTWPTPKQLFNNTVAVVVIVVIVVAIVFVLDSLFEAMNKYGITNLQSYVVDKFGTDEEKTDENEEENAEQSNEDENQVEDSNTDGDNSAEDVTTTDNEDSTQTEQ